MIYFTSDLHFGHNKEFLYKPRGYDSLEEMTKDIILKWNSTVCDEDDVYILGDLMLTDTPVVHDQIKSLKGRLHIICGNHDTERRIELYRTFSNVVEVTYAKPLKYGKYHFWLSHYPTITSSDDKEGLHKYLINLYGHTHQSLSPFYHDAIEYVPWMYNVGLDCHHNRVVSIEQIIVDCEGFWENFNALSVNYRTAEILNEMLKNTLDKEKKF